MAFLATAPRGRNLRRDRDHGPEAGVIRERELSPLVAHDHTGSRTSRSLRAASASSTRTTSETSTSCCRTATAPRCAGGPSHARGRRSSSRGAGTTSRMRTSSSRPRSPTTSSPSSNEPRATTTPGHHRSSRSLAREDLPERHVRAFLEASVSLGGGCGLKVIRALHTQLSVRVCELLANHATCLAVVTCLRAWDVLARALAVFAVRVPAIPREAQRLLLLGRTRPGHRPRSVSHAARARKVVARRIRGDTATFRASRSATARIASATQAAPPHLRAARDASPLAPSLRSPSTARSRRTWREGTGPRRGGRASP